jgi:hypothetical protein
MKISLEHEDVCTAVREFMESRGMQPPETDEGFTFKPEDSAPSTVVANLGRIVVEVGSVHLDRKRPTAPADPAPSRRVLGPPKFVKNDPIARAAEEAVRADGGEEFPTETLPDTGGEEEGTEPAPLSDGFDEVIPPRELSDLDTDTALKKMLGMMDPEDQKKALAVARRVRGGESLSRQPTRSTVFASLDEAGKGDGDFNDEIG